MSEKQQIPEWKGSALTNAAFLNYAKDALRVKVEGDGFASAVVKVRE